MTDLWPSLVALIDARRPGFLATAEGVERAELARWEARFGLALPRIYVDLMRTMGGSSGAFNPLGAYEHRLEPLAEYWAWMAEEEPAPYPRDQYFLIGFDPDPSAISPFELFLDLSRGDGADAALVEMGSNGVYGADARHDIGQTLGELLAERTLTFFELSDRPERSGLLIFGDEPTLPSIKADVVKQLRDMGGSPVPPDLAGVTCLRFAGTSVLVSLGARQGWVAVAIAGNAREDGVALLNRLRASWPRSTPRSMSGDRARRTGR
ncbi:SMI1/KNR4 family protein [Nannocystis sp. SCPEA4]|uniref:SMI1/KNR4 family protein n=1 Tax=Nannocystis sp. SCPEA4 TaxID=2996787 RepID=UPI00227009F3|nr:SMI1/KNR4 family protein [Nannocystis sp. SCPEA4]MCY1059071.1 SMI1/KNR4 family protein [Nannocystis sp. SCPEA4]